MENENHESSLTFPSWVSLYLDFFGILFLAASLVYRIGKHHIALYLVHIKDIKCIFSFTQLLNRLEK